MSVAVGDKMDVLVVEVTPVSGGILLAFVAGGSEGGGRPGQKSSGKKGRRHGSGKKRVAKGQRKRRTG